MRLHVEALFTLDAAGRLLTVNEPGGAEAPRFFLGRTADGNACWFRHDVDAALAADLTALCASQHKGLAVEAVLDDAPFVVRLAREEPVRKNWLGPAFRFPADLPGRGRAVRMTFDNAAVLTPYLEDWLENVSLGVPMTAVLEDGKAVSLCCSVRMTSRAHEAGVETHPDFRGRGHAARAVAAWARAVRELERVPLYSTSWENEASRALAAKLGLVQYGADLHMT